MGVISQNGIDYPVPSVPVQSDGSATDLTNAAVPTGQTIKSYLNSNFVMEVHTTQVLLPSSVTVNISSAAQLLSDVDIRTLTYQALEDIRSMTKELKAAILLWSTGGGCVATDVLVSNNKLNLKVNNISSVSQTITAIRLLTFWK